MDTGTYFIVNYMVTLIWVVIPLWINGRRYKYRLPMKMVVWPLRKKFFEGVLNDLFEALPLLVIFSLITAPLMVMYIVLYRFIYKLIIKPINKWVTRTVMFSKEDRAQIAVGAISKRK